MKAATLIFVLAAATLFQAAVSSADDAFEPVLAPPAPGEKPLTPSEQALVQRFDRNGDGKLEQDEIDLARGSMQKLKQGREVLARKLYDKLLERFDADHKGQLSPAEQEEAVVFLQAKRPALYELLLKQFDRNGDHKLDAAETAALFQYLSGLPAGLSKEALPGAAIASSMESDGAAPAPPMSGPAMAKKIYERMLEAFDRDQKGYLSPAEQTEALEYLESNNPKIYQRMLDRFDANHNGALDPEELETMFGKLSQLKSAVLPGRIAAPTDTMGATPGK